MKHELTSAIKPTYVTFEQAKLLKEKGFDLRIKQCYVSKETILFLYDENNTLGWCNRNLPKNEYSAPEQWQVVEWLRVEKGIEVCIIPDSSSQSQLLLRKYTYSIFTPINGANLHCQIGRKENGDISYFLKPQEAYSAAFDYVLNSLI